MKFSIGDLVVEKKSFYPYTSYNILKIVGFIDDAVLVTHHAYAFDGEIYPEKKYEEEPGSKSWRTGIQRVLESNLLTPDEAVNEIHLLENAKDKLDAEFISVKDQLAAKFDQAAELVKEAADIVKAHKKTFYDLKQEGMSLYRALDDGGWSHSHMKC